MKTIVFLIGLIWFFFPCFSHHVTETQAGEGDPCCSYPCQHMGICVSSTAEIYECDCTGTGHYGTHCEIPYFSTTLKNWLKPSKDSLHHFLTHYSLLWKIINNIDRIRKFFMKTLLKIRLARVDDPHLMSGFDEYANWESYSNRSSYARSLPAVPLNCPTPMGVKGKKSLPDPDEIIEKFLKRKSFTPCPRRTSVVFPLFAQHFTHQFFKTDYKKGLPYQLGDHALDLSHVYGETLERQLELRLQKDGKLKFSMINGEMFPPTIDQAKVEMHGIDKINKPYQFATGHPGFTIQPALLFFSTLWLREHNRVCDILKKEHSSWDDERLFQTTRLILTSETLKIVIEDYVQHLSGYNYKLLFDPELLHDTEFSYHNRIFMEFQILYRWHALMPDQLNINNQTYSIRNVIFNPKPFVEGGMANWVDEAKKQFAGKVAGGKTQGEATLNVARQTILDGRKLRLQPLNRYRERFGMKPYKTFSEFTDDAEMARELEELYGDVDALEFYVGVMLEKRRSPLMFGQTITEVGSPFSLKGIFSNPICSPAWWKPSTFGGEKGFQIAKTTNLQELVCRNVKGCPSISFEVPYGIEYNPDGMEKMRPQDNSSEIIMNITRGSHVPDTLLNPIKKQDDFEQKSETPIKENLKSEL